MNNQTLQQPEQPVIEIQNEQTTELPVWRAPVITRIEIKRTMLSSGTIMDGSGSNSP